MPELVRCLRGLLATVVAAGSLVLPALVTASPASAAGGVFVPDADTYVDASAPSTSFGTRSTVRVDGSPTVVTYLKFTVTGFPQVGHAVLRVYFDRWTAALDGTATGVTAYAVGDDSWAEGTLTYDDRPALGARLGTAERWLLAGTWVEMNVSKLVTGNGTYTIAIARTGTSAVRFSSRETAQAPQLVVEAEPTVPTSFTVSPTSVAGQYQAVSPQTGSTYTGYLSRILLSAVAELEDRNGGGTIQFAAGVFDGGVSFWYAPPLHDITFEGAGMDKTVIRWVADSSSEGDVLQFRGADDVTIRDLTISGSGDGVNARSDAIDLGDSRSSLIENVKIDASHGRGIVLDGAHAGWDSYGNVVRNVVMTSGVRYTGIELVGSRDDVIENCTIDGVQGHGIRVRKAAPGAGQPNKRSSGNIVRNNVITRAGLDGVNVTSSDDTQVVGNAITSSGRAATGPGGGRSGIRVTTLDGVPADRTLVGGNAVSDPLRWQRHGLDIDSPLVIGTVVSGNSFSGSRFGPIRDHGTGTLFP